VEGKTFFSQNVLLSEHFCLSLRNE
jgi:hypothetical protein